MDREEDGRERRAGREHREHRGFGDTRFNFYLILFSLYYPLASTQYHRHDGSDKWGSMEAGRTARAHIHTQKRTHLCTQDLGSKVYPEPAVTVPCISLVSNHLALVMGMIQGIRAAGVQSFGL